MTCDSTAYRGCLSTPPRTARSSPHQPRPLLRSSSPSATHPTPAAWEYLATCPATSAHSCDSFLTVDHTHSPGRPRPLAPPPLRYAGTSRLLQASPPARQQRYSAPRGFRRLEFSLSPPVFRRQCQAAPSHVPYKSLDRTHAASIPETTWPVSGYP